MFKSLLFALFPVLLGVGASAAMAQAPVYDPQGRMIPHDERKVEPQEYAAAAPVTKPAPPVKKRHVIRHKAKAKPAVKKTPRTTHKKHKKAAPR